MFTREVFYGNVPVAHTGIRIYKPLFGKRYLYIDGGKVDTNEILSTLDQYDRFLESDRETDYTNNYTDKRVKGWPGYFYKDRLEIGCKRFFHGDIDFLLKLLKIKRKLYV